jgi:hypothetical protein
MKKKIRKFIVDNFAGYRISIFGTPVVNATKIIFPFFVIMGVLYIIWPTWIVATIFLVGVVTIIWIAFPFFKYSYFNLFPVEWDEMKDYDKYLYVRSFPEKITPEQMEYYITYLKDKYSNIPSLMTKIKKLFSKK